MELLLLESTIVSILEACGIFSALIIPFFFLLLIARFRGFFASIFFLPFIHGLLYFLTTIEVVNTTLIGLGDFGNGLLAGITVISEFFITFHSFLMGVISGLINNEMVTQVLLANWFSFVPYLILFVIFFAIFKKRKAPKEEDYF